MQHMLVVSLEDTLHYRRWYVGHVVADSHRIDRNKAERIVFLGQRQNLVRCNVLALEADNGRKQGSELVRSRQTAVCILDHGESSGRDVYYRDFADTLEESDAGRDFQVLKHETIRKKIELKVVLHDIVFAACCGPVAESFGKCLFQSLQYNLASVAIQDDECHRLELGFANDEYALLFLF
jgi:hypothetical protein